MRKFDTKKLKNLSLTDKLAISGYVMLAVSLVGFKIYMATGEKLDMFEPGFSSGSYYSDTSQAKLTPLTTNEPPQPPSPPTVPQEPVAQQPKPKRQSAPHQNISLASHQEPSREDRDHKPEKPEPPSTPPREDIPDDSEEPPHPDDDPDEETPLPSELPLPDHYEERDT